jgi:hypothetical protein
MKSRNPMQIMESMVGQNPQYANALSLAKQMTSGKSETELEQTVKNVCNQRGIAYDDLKKTLNQFGLRV